MAGIAVSLAVAMASGCASRSDSDPVTLTFSDGFSTTHPVGKGGAQLFRKYLEEHGPGVGLDVEYFAAGQLGKPRDALHLLRSGAVDITPVIPPYFSNDIPMSSVADLPGLVDDSCTGIDSVMPMLQPGGSIYEEEIEVQGVVPLWGVLIPDYYVWTADEPVPDLSGLHGSLIRTPGGAGDRVVSELGASGVIVPNSDIYEAVARGTVDGAILAPLSVKSYSLDEVLKYATESPSLFTASIYYAASADLWNSLTEDQRTVLREASEIAQAGACSSVQTAQDAAKSAMQESGVQFLSLDDESEKKWESALSPIRDNWVRDLQSVGLPASTILAEFEARLSEEAR